MEQRVRLTPTNLMTMSPVEVMQALHEYILGSLPEGIDNPSDDIKRIEYFLGRLSNDYSYIIELLNYSRHYVRKLKKSDKDLYEDMMDIRDALESTASAIKLRYDASSRMLTAYQQKLEEKDMRGYRTMGGGS